MFKQNLADAKPNEGRAMAYLQSKLPDAVITEVIGETDRDTMLLQRIYGDIRVTKSDSEVFYVEVKTDFKAKATGNLFLELLSDNGERTGNITKGWFLNPATQYKYYLFFIHGTDKVIQCNKTDLETYASSRAFFTATINNPTLDNQMNRSEGILVPYRGILEAGVGKLIQVH